MITINGSELSALPERGPYWAYNDPLVFRYSNAFSSRKQGRIRSVFYSACSKGFPDVCTPQKLKRQYELKILNFIITYYFVSKINNSFSQINYSFSDMIIYRYFQKL